MMKPKIPANEAARMKELLRLELLDTDAESEFNEVVSIASYITGCPISLISLIDHDRQWFKAKVGLDAAETHRDISFCGHAILGDELFEIKNATEDERFATNPLVQNDPSIRFYAGQPLITSNGYRLGTLCTIDRIPKELNEGQKAALANLAKHAVNLMEVRIAKREIEQTRNALSTERKKLEQVIQTSPAAMALWRGPQFIFEMVNPNYQAIFPGRNLIGKPFVEVCPEYLGTSFIEILTQVLETGEKFIGKEVPAPVRVSDDAEPEIRYFDFTYVRIVDDEGKPYGVFDHAFDVTERVLARKKIEESELQFSVLANSIPQLAWMARPDGFIYWYNKNWYDYTGTTPEQMEGWGWQSVHDPKYLPKVMETWPSSISSGLPWVMEFPLRSASGEYRWFLTRASPVKDESGNVLGWIGSNTDIQDQIDVIRKLEDEREIRERFVETLTHDLRTPMTAGKMTAQLLGRKEFPQADVKKMADRISANMDRADTMIRNLLDANRLKAGEGIPVSMGAERMDRIIESALDDLHRVYGPRFEFMNQSGEVPGFWDGNGIQRVIENLAANGVKYGAPKSMVSITLQTSESQVQILVHNEGNAIPASELKNLFNAYHRSDSALLSGQKGWGIGLALVRGLTEAHSGFVKAESNPDSGTTFTVSLPIDARKNHA